MRLLALSLLFILAGCKSKEPVDPNVVTVNLQFTHLVDGNEVILDQVIYKNALGQDFSVKTIKYFVSRIQLHQTDNNTIDLDDIIYVDVRTPELLNQELSQKIPTGDYQGISFVYGLVPEDNITGSFPSQPESLMEWPVPMGGGYHYMKLEGDYVIDGQSNFYNFHAGMLGGTPYEIHIDRSNQPFSVTGNRLDIELSMEIQNWFTGPNDWDFAYFGGGIMNNPEAQQTVHENGQDVFSFKILANQP